MQVEADIKCMQINFGGCGLFDFEVMAPFCLPSKMAKICLYSPWSSKNLIDRNWLKKFMQIRIDELCMCTNFGGCDLFSFGDTATLKNGQISLSTHGLYIVHGHQKI